MIAGLLSAPGFEVPASQASSGGSLDTQTVVSGADGTAANTNRRRGFIVGQLGSCAPGTSAIYASATIRELAAEEENGNPNVWDVIFTVAGAVANSGWTSLVTGTFTLLRANATFSTAGGNSSWTWQGAGNPFGGSGSSHVVGFN